MSHLWMSRVCQSCRHQWQSASQEDRRDLSIVSHISMSHVTDMNESCDTRDRWQVRERRRRKVSTLLISMPSTRSEYLSHDSFICVQRLIHVCGMTLTTNQATVMTLSTRSLPLIHTCWMLSSVCHDSLIWVTWLIDMSDMSEGVKAFASWWPAWQVSMTHSHDSFTCTSRLDGV